MWADAKTAGKDAGATKAGVRAAGCAGKLEYSVAEERARRCRAPTRISTMQIHLSRNNDVPIQEQIAEQVVRIDLADMGRSVLRPYNGIGG